MCTPLCVCPTASPEGSRQAEDRACGAGGVSHEFNSIFVLMDTFGCRIYSCITCIIKDLKSLCRKRRME